MAVLYQLDGITKDYISGAVRFSALRGIDCTIGSGKVVALVGPSGSGKSTLLNVLGLIERPTSGSLVFAGEDLAAARESELTEIRRQGVGFIFQNFNLVPVLSAVENVEYALQLEGKLRRAAARAKAMEVLEALGLADFCHHKPAELSGGQRQRVAIARAVVKNPRVIVADEPTANLDSATAEQILKIIRDLNRNFGTTVIVATHDPAVANAADEVVHIRDGLVQNPIARSTSASGRTVK